MSALDLPQDVIVEILRRSDAVALLRFRAVSREWCTTISSPGFAKAHLRIAEERFSIIMPRFKDIVCYDNKDPLFVSYISREMVPFLLWLEIQVSIRGACNGLLLLFCTHGLMIWNPITRRNRHILFPSPIPLVFCVPWHQSSFISGLAHDARTGDYYGVIVSHHCNVNTTSLSLDSVHAYLVNFTTRAWKNIKTCFLPFHANDNAGTTLFNGVLHWAVRIIDTVENICNSYLGTGKMISFDAENEIFKEFSLPDGMPRCDISDVYIGVSKGLLCLFCPNPKDNLRSDIWVMEDYGVESSWQKMLTLLPFISSSCFIYNNKILTVHDYSLVLYDPENGSTTFIDHGSDYMNVKMIPFAKSLAWIHDA